MVRQRGSIAKEDLQLGDEVRTLHNGNILMTMFLGWIHKEGNLIERSLKLRRESAQISLSEKYVIFRQKGERVTLWQWHLLIWLRRATFWRWCWMERYNGRGWSTLTLREGKESTAPHHLQHHFGRQCIGILLCWLCLPVCGNISFNSWKCTKNHICFMNKIFSRLTLHSYPWSCFLGCWRTRRAKPRTASDCTHVCSPGLALRSTWSNLTKRSPAFQPSLSPVLSWWLSLSSASLTDQFVLSKYIQ